MKTSDKKVIKDTARLLADYLPPGWSIKPSLISETVDAGLIFTSGEGQSKEVPVVVRRRIDPRAAKQLNRLPVMMVVAPYISRSVRTVLEEFGVCYADTTGNIRVVLSEPGLFMVASGAQSNPQPERRRLSLRGAKAGRIVKALAVSNPPIGVRELAKRADADPGYTSRLLTLLEREALVDRLERGQVERIDWRKLLSRWASDAPLSSRAEESTWIAPRGLDALIKRLKNTTMNYLVTGSAAASRVANVAPTRLLSLYVEDSADAGQMLGLQRAYAGVNVILLEPRDDAIYKAGVDNDGLRLAPWTVVAADLLTGPGRSPVEAEALLDWMDDHKDAWRG